MKQIITVVVLGLVGIIILASQFLLKVRVECKSQYGDCPGEILSQFARLGGKNLFTVRRGVEKILKTDFLVYDFSLQFKLPNILSLQLLVKKPEFAIRNSVSGKTVLIDKDGSVLSEASASALPDVLISGSLPGIGKNVNTSILHALNITDGLYKMYQVKEGLIQNDSLLVELPSQIRVIFPLDGDVQVLLGSLRLIYSKIQDGGVLNSYSEIDLRFKNPVLR